MEQQGALKNYNLWYNYMVTQSYCFNIHSEIRKHYSLNLRNLAVTLTVSVKNPHLFHITLV